LKRNASHYGIKPEDVDELEKELSTLSFEETSFTPLMEVPLIGPVRARVLKILGIFTIDDLLSHDPKELTRQINARRLNRFLPPSQLQLIYRYAKAVKENRIFVLGRVPELMVDPIFLDLEYDPNVPFIFMIGVMEDNEVTQWFIESEDQEKHALSKLLDMVKERPTKTWITYSGVSADVPILKKRLEKHRLRLPACFKIVDLFYDIIEPRTTERQRIYISLKLRNLKVLSEYFGFNPDSRVKISDGFEALLYYHKYQKESNSKRKANLKKQLLAYNREDLRRIKHIFEKLRSIVNDSSS